MEVRLLQETLAGGVSAVSRAVARRSTLPVLSHIYLGAEGNGDGDGRLTLAATNLEIGMRVSVAAKVGKEGAFTVPAALFGDLVNQSPSEAVELTLNGGAEIAYRCAQLKAKVKGIEATEFPVIPAFDSENAVGLPQPVLKRLINLTAFSAATDVARPILTGVLIARDGNTIKMAGADGFRLSVAEATVEVGESEAEAFPSKVIVPATALKELARLLNNDDLGEDAGNVLVAFHRLRPDRPINQIAFALDTAEVELVSQIIDGNFPDYAQIIPKQRTARAIVDREALQKAVRRAYIFAKDAANIVRCSFSDNNTLTVSAEAADVGGNAEQLVAALDGQPVTIAFNAKYLLDVLGVIDSPVVSISLIASSSPVCFGRWMTTARTTRVSPTWLCPEARRFVCCRLEERTRRDA